MPKFLENKLKREYPNNPGAVYGTLNAIGAMRGNRRDRERPRDAGEARRTHERTKRT